MKKHGAARQALAEQRRARARRARSPTRGRRRGRPSASASSRKYSATRPELRPSAPGADPDDLAGRAQLVEPRRRVGAGAARQHVALPHVGGQREALQRDEHLAQAVDPGARRGVAVDALPGRQERRERALVGRLDLLAQHGERRAAQAAQDLGVAPLALGPPGRSSPRTSVAGALERRAAPRVGSTP